MDDDGGGGGGGGEEENADSGRRRKKRTGKTSDENAENGRRINVELTCGFTLLSLRSVPAIIESTLTLNFLVDLV